MSGRARSRSSGLAVESLEGRALLSAAGSIDLSQLLGGVSSIVARSSNAKYDPEGVAAVMAALNGGAGGEFVALAKRQVPNYQAIISQFLLGQRTSFTMAGGAAKVANWQPLYKGPHNDHLTATMAGALVLSGNKLELAGVMRGKFDEPTSSQVVF